MTFTVQWWHKGSPPCTRSLTVTTWRASCEAGVIYALYMLFALSANKVHVLCEGKECKGSPGQGIPEANWLQSMAGRHSPLAFWIPETLPAQMAWGTNTAIVRHWTLLVFQGKHLYDALSNRSCRKGH